MKILVIGGAGFIGQNLILRLMAEHHAVRVFDRVMPQSPSSDSFEYVQGDFAEIERFAQILEGIDVVYHLASTTIPKTSNDSPTYDIQSNVMSTVKLLEMCCSAGVRKFVFSSSGGTVYGIPTTTPLGEDSPTDPICSYGIAKLTIEKYLAMFHHLYGLEYQVLRISNPYGPYQNHFSQQGAVGVFLGRIYRNQEIEIWGDGSVCRDYIYIDDVVEALYLSATTDTQRKVLNIGSGNGTTLIELIEVMKRVVGKEIRANFVESRKLDTPISILDISRAHQELGWLPKVDLERGIDLTWKWINQMAVK